jgi:hypothetical protein
MGISMVSYSTAVRRTTEYVAEFDHIALRALEMRSGAYWRRVLESPDSTPFARSVAENSIAIEVVDLFS